MAQIYELIGKAMRDIGAIGKDSVNEQQKFKYRGIDAVYNALNPVMAKYGLFICPEILEQRRDERVTKTGTVLTFTLLTIKFTMYAPDGSNVSLTVVGEGMDSGDKGSNKAMSVAMKYAMFQLFMIPTEEMRDPDADVYTDIKPKIDNIPKPEKPVKPTAAVSKGGSVPATEISNPVLNYLAQCRKELQDVRQISKEDNAKLFSAQTKALIKSGLAPDKPFPEYTMEEAISLIANMYQRFDPEGTEVKNA